MTTLFRYPGGKTKIKQNILNDLINKIANNSITKYVEPFIGGGSIGISLLEHLKTNNKTNIDIIINDKDLGIYCLWNAVIYDPDSLMYRIYSFKPTVEAFYDYKNQLLNYKIQDYHLDKNESINLGFKKLVAHQLSYSGLGTRSGSPLGGNSQESKYKIDCRWNPKLLSDKIAYLNGLFNCFNIYTSCCDYEDIIKTHDSVNTLYYLDPPYYVRGDELYQYSLSTDDHMRLYNLLKKISGKWLLSYDNCKLIKDLYSFWSVIKYIDIKYSIASAKESTELMISSPD